MNVYMTEHTMAAEGSNLVWRFGAKKVTCNQNVKCDSTPVHGRDVGGIELALMVENIRPSGEAGMPAWR